MKILKKLFPVLYKYEEQILKSVEKKLNGIAKDIYRKQINSYNKVQRFRESKEVNLYSQKYFKIKFDESIKFPIRLEEVKFALVSITTNIQLKLKVEIWIVNGRIFSLNFNKSPKVLKENPYEITDIKILVDPMNECIVNEIEARYTQIEFWLNKNSISLSIGKVYESIKNSDKRNSFNNNEINYPSDYLEMLDYCDGFISDEFEIYGLHNIREINTEKNKYFIIAECGKEFILVLCAKPNNGHIYLIDQSDDSEEIKDLGESFAVALKEYILIVKE